MGAEEEKVQENEKSTPAQNPMSQAQFLSWKRRKDADASAKRDEAARKRAEDIAAGAVQMNGRELFLHEPWEKNLKNVKVMAPGRGQRKKDI